MKVTSLKATIVDILVAVTNLRANFRLAKLMQKFKEYNSDEYLKVIHIYICSKGGVKHLSFFLFSFFFLSSFFFFFFFFFSLLYTE